MRIAVINEVSASAKNADIVSALAEFSDFTVLNVGMTRPDEQPELSYIQTGLMAALLLNAGACDMVIGGCGTGQGFLNSAMQYPGVFCGLVKKPLDAWLFSQINAGNCVSLALNEGYGWAGDVNVRLLLRELFRDEPGAGYPATRAVPQRESRQTLSAISAAAHKTMDELLPLLNDAIKAPIRASEKFMNVYGRELL